ncbi:MAG: glycosyltransferase family 4 protein [Algicola sp.]|nr:glycosyltransferase family 4 protein [Algicola sp.]
MNEKITVGLVLYTVPKYSETFFRNKIMGLQENGFDVVLFVLYHEKNNWDIPCDVIYAKNFGSGFFKTLVNTLGEFSKTIFLNPKRSYRLYQLDKSDGISLKSRFKHLVLSQFLFQKHVDWLHFGFGMLATERENVAEAMQANMAVSFRGFDLYLSPLVHKGCYDILFQKAVKYHVLSEEMKNTLLDHRIKQDQIEVITPAIDVNFFKSDEKRSQTKRLELVTVSRLHWKKGLEYTIEALSYLKEAGVDFHYTIIGTGIEKERLVFAAHQLGVLECVTFTGKLSHEAVKRHLSQADMYLQYSIQEGFCNAVLEAQAMGLLCLVSNAEGLSENVIHEETGWVIEKRQPALLAAKIIEVQQMTEEEKQQIRTRAMQRVNQEFNLDQQHQKFVNFYR